MALPDDDRERLQRWLVTCMPGRSVRLSSARNIRNGSEREVWDCTFRLDAGESAAILAIFKPGSLETVNTSLPPHDAAQKCVLAMSELPNLGIPTPRVLGHAQAGGEAALLCERIEPTGWTAKVRILAARVLARLHNLEASRLSEPLRRLAQISDPGEYRTTGGHGPAPATRTLVHGDYFSANILPTEAGVCIIDWETFGWGDPMWDLGFLIGADRDLPSDEVDAVIREYESLAPVDRERLMWHTRQWADYWQQRDRQASNRAEA